MTLEEFYVKTDNANKLMDRVWYCLGGSEPVSDQKVFWEHWYWKEGEKDKPMDKKKAKVGCNHTLTIAVKDDKEADYPIWPLKFTTDSYKMCPAIDLGCTIITPIGLPMTPVMFPTDDSRTEFRVDFCSLMGKKMYFIFVLDPLISAADQDKNFEILEKEHGIRKEWFNMVPWDPEYKIGSAGEPDINPK
eukprot:CAMPEP_0113612420 /NCGR_PEP_ID=MMETSP0017_2-20120614/6091_1 /TAXON_ID=2856 /ORGANISM="Cylindrotheca closterium" /LENGTH=189 /DNA_ID=CAMNT_0000521455 /DNA_START=117 /DNA_END=686 /DNA_ORIENTATION=+ /assembly_acc=CAM_ASM_000147